ncbi:hypothetical protein D9M69_500440 [compost metagenome]
MNAIATVSEISLAKTVLAVGERATFDRIVESIGTGSKIAPAEIASLAILGLRYLARGAQPYDLAGKQETHDEILNAQDLLRIHKRRMRASNWWDLKRIDGAVVTFVNLGCMSFEEGNDWFREKMKAHEKANRKAKNSTVEVPK